MTEKVSSNSKQLLNSVKYCRLCNRLFFFRINDFPKINKNVKNQTVLILIKCKKQSCDLMIS